MVTVSVIQNHIYTNETIECVNPPIRIVLGRKQMLRKRLDPVLMEKVTGEVLSMVKTDRPETRKTDVEFLPDKTKDIDDDLDSDIESSVEILPEKILEIAEKQKNTGIGAARPTNMASAQQQNTDQQDDILKDPFLDLVKSYREEMKYIDGFGQTQDRSITLK